jgi:multidrug efflux pump
MAKNTNKIKSFFLTNFALKNRISVYVLVVIAVIMGIRSYTSMPKESFPEIKQPTIYINTPYFGNSPADIENLVTRPIEKQLKSLSGISKLSSSSVQDFSIIIAEFNLDIPPSEALQDVKDAVDKAKKDLPSDLDQDPNIFELDFSEFPVMNVNLFGNLPYAELKEHAEYLQDLIENLGEISEAPISGLQDDEVKVHVDLFKMESLKISFNDIENAIKGENVSMSGGDIKIEGTLGINRRTIRIDGEFAHWRELGDVIVKEENQNIVYLRDIAEISFGSVEPTSFARLNGDNVLTLDIKKRSGENLISASDKIKDIVEKAKKEHLPSSLNLVITNDQSQYTRNMVSNLENSIILGVLLVVLVLMFFLGLRNSMFVGIAIPLSMLLGIAILSAQGSTLNMMVLFSLILALGMLVDNGIVVVENVYRWRTDLKFSNEKSSKYGVGEVAMPIIASTATTVAAFIPLLFWKDIIGEFMKYLPITLIIVLSASVFVALVVNPVLTAKYMKSEKDVASNAKKFWIRFIILILLGVVFKLPYIISSGENSSGMSVVGGIFLFSALFSLIYRFLLLRAIDFFREKLLPKIEDVYLKTIYFALGGYKPIFIFIGTFVLMIGSIMFFGASNPKVLFFPENEPRVVNIFIEAPLGTDIQTTNEYTLELEKLVRKAIEPNQNIVEAVLAQVGEKTSDPNEGPQAGSSPHKARITVSFFDSEERINISKVSTKKVMEDIRQSLSGFNSAYITVSKDRMGPPVGKPINLEIKGEDYNKLIILVEKIKKALEEKDVPGVDKLKTDLELDRPEILVKVNRDAAKRFGISTGQIAQTLRTALLGKEVSKYKQGEDDYPIQVRLQDEYRYNINNLLNMKVTFRNNTGKLIQVPISTICEIEYTSSFGTVRRLGMERVVTIFSEVKEGFSPSAIVEELKEVMAKIPMEEGYTYKFTGELEKQNESSDFMAGALLFAVFLIFLIIVSQFNSVIYPLIIMVSVMFSTIGVFLGFGITGMDFVILMCGIGIISLAGVVVNNAIVMIDYMNILKENKKAELGISPNKLLPKNELAEVLAQAGKTRLRPVLLTAITTVLGLFPMALGMNIDFYSLLKNFNPNFYVGGDSANFWGPMSWTIIFGLTFATFLTLVVVPVMVLIADKILIRIKGK